MGRVDSTAIEGCGQAVTDPHGIGNTLASLALPGQSDRAEAAIGPLTWEDEFNAPAGTPVDQNKWRFDIGCGWGNTERQYHTDSTSNAVHDGQGNLVITARRENPANYQCHYGRCEYPSARLLTAATFTQTYGRFEARIKIPRGQGIWASGRRSGCSAPAGGPTPGTTRLRGAQSGRCIDIPSANPVEGAKLQIWDCNTTAAQAWTFASDGTVRSRF
ncbi:ricin-type beta-trefoil lectin domain protein [Micromonospora sp. DT4]|uniref:glycoside hydrolase family 16 protein n=1 Tax=Micromonospora sp. DT4 TaxID=3393438 RepID=UPI003CF3A81C